MQYLKKIFSKYTDLFITIGFVFLFYTIFFHNIGNYALMDTDETRYVTMAKEMFFSKDFLTLYLNNEYFFEKPPLYFWGECISFALFGKVNEFTARFPVALYSSCYCFLFYFLGKKLISRSYGIITTVILATSLEFVILSKFAILDIVVTTCIGFALFFGMVIYFCRESRKKYYWWLFYFFSGLAVMAKGIPGFAIPFGSMFFISLISKNLKEVFKPVYIIPGLIIFLLVTLPWHIVMFKLYNPLFWEEYIIKHHLARFLGSEIINREQPFYFYFITLLWGFFPWIISCSIVWIKNLIDFIKKKDFVFKYENLNTIDRLILYNSIIVAFTLLFFSISGTKLITYILPIYGSLACLGGYVWWKFINKQTHEKILNISNYILGSIFLLAGLVGSLTQFYLPTQINQDISEAKLFCIITSLICGFGTILFTKKRYYIGVFISITIFMTLFSAFATKKFYEIDYKFGQNDLMEFAQIAKNRNISLTTFNFGSKYCLNYYGEKVVNFGPQLEPKDLKKELKEKNNYVIIKNKDLKNIKQNCFDIIKTGRKYSLIEEKGAIK